MLQFSLTGTGNEDEVVTESLETAAVTIEEAVAEVLTNVTGTVRASAQQGCSIEIDVLARVWFLRFSRAA